MEELIKMFEDLKSNCEKVIGSVKDQNLQKILKQSDIGNLQGIKDKLVSEIEGHKNDLANIKEVVSKEKQSVVDEINKKSQEINQKQTDVLALEQLAIKKSNEATAQLELYKMEMAKATDLKANADKLIAEYSKKISDMKDFVSKN